MIEDCTESSEPMQEEIGASEDAGEEACEMEEEAEAELLNRPRGGKRRWGPHALKDHLLFVTVPRVGRVAARTKTTRSLLSRKAVKTL